MVADPAFSLPIRIPNVHFDADPDSAFHYDADLDQAFHYDADMDPLQRVSAYRGCRPVVYLQSYVMVGFEAGKILYKGHWKGWAREIETFLGPEMAMSEPT